MSRLAEAYRATWSEPDELGRRSRIVEEVEAGVSRGGGRRVRQRRSQMPEVPEAARGAAQRQPAGLKSIFTSLLSKAVTGPVAVREDTGMVSYGRIPEDARKKISAIFKEKGIEEPVFSGWDPRKLEPRERALLERLVTVGTPEFNEPSPEQQQRYARMAKAQERMEKIQRMREMQRKPWQDSREWGM